jgi:hypothetical protein
MELNEDTPEARKARTDPHQQMRQHIVGCHANKIIDHTRKLGWLLDTLFFDMPKDRARWRAQIAKLIDHHYAEP